MSGPNYLAGADIGVSLHQEYVETTFSFRTRVLNYMWAGLPLILTAGDEMAKLADRTGSGEGDGLATAGARATKAR